MNKDFDFAQKLVICGCGGHSKVVSEVAESIGFKEITYIDQNNDEGYFLGRTKVKNIRENYSGYFFIAIGDNFLRENIYKQFLQDHKSAKSVTLIHPSSVISKRSEIKGGSVVMPLAVVNTDCNIGKGVIINTSSVVEHDAKLMDFSSLAPNSAVGGRAIIGERTAISIGANIKHGVKIGNDVVVGASSCVLNDLEPNIVSYGIPAKFIRNRKKGEKYL